MKYLENVDDIPLRGKINVLKGKTIDKAGLVNYLNCIRTQKSIQPPMLGGIFDLHFPLKSMFCNNDWLSVKTGSTLYAAVWVYRVVTKHWAGLRRNKSSFQNLSVTMKSKIWPEERFGKERRLFGPSRLTPSLHTISGSNLIGPNLIVF